MSVLDEAISMLEGVSKQYGAIGVAYSDGKDSRVILDMCMRLFPRVEAFFMYFVPGLECVELALQAATKRYPGLVIRQYPHWVLAKSLFTGTFCDAWYKTDELPPWKLHNVYAHAMVDCDVQRICTGAKRADGAWRRRFMATERAEGIVYPIASWLKYDVLAYLKARSIPIPESSGHAATGIDLSPASLLWMSRTYPRDFQKICEHFPYAEAVVWREKFYGISA